jgi:hypothetical protein
MALETSAEYVSSEDLNPIPFASTDIAVNSTSDLTF